MQSLVLSVSAFYLPVDRIAEEVEALDRAGVDLFHVDLMDGGFVGNLGMSMQDLDAIRRHTKRPIDVHMMVNDPARYIGLAAEHGADILYVHAEADRHPAATLAAIRALGCMSGLAVNPGTSFAQVEELLPLCDYVLLMTVNPGFAGQSYLDFVEPKIKRFAAGQARWGYTVMIDGGVTPAVIARLAKQGVRGFICGNRVLLGQQAPYDRIVPRIRAAAEGKAVSV